MIAGAAVLAKGFGFLEGPRWHEGRLWCSDFASKQVMAVTLDGQVEVIVDAPGQPSGLGWLPDGRLLVVAMLDRRLLRLEPDGLVEVANLWNLASYHCNDMVVSADGHAYIGNFGFDLDAEIPEPTLAELILVTPDGTARVVAEEMAFPNGSVITPDGQTLIVAESGAARLLAFTIEADGLLSHRRIWAQFDDRGIAETHGRVIPDGICLDAEGAIWVASPSDTNPAVWRIGEGGGITDCLTEALIPYACMLGGDDGRTLFIVGTGTDATGEPLPEPNGRILTVRVDVPHAGLP